MAFILPFIPYVAAAVSAVSAYQQGQANANAAGYNAQIGEVNKGMALRDQERKAQLAAGRARAAYGASGVQLGTGSPLDVLADAAGQSEYDKLKIRFNYDSRINLDRAQESSYRTSSVLNAVGAGFKAYGSAIPMFGSSGAGGGGDVNAIDPVGDLNRSNRRMID